jgi:molybdopterin-guanine dinucleotide biosynthesis protein A
MQERRLAAAILVGGRATRMGGASKSALTIGGLPIIDRQLAALRPIADPVFAVASADGPAPAGLACVRDRFPNHGALGGIYTAIVESPRDRTIVIACDLPFLTTRFFEHLAAIDADLVIPRSDRGYEPLAAVYSRRCAEPIRKRLARGALGAQALATALADEAGPDEGVTVAEIGPEASSVYDPDRLLFVNVNTPHDYERANKLMEERSKTSRDRIMDELGP